MFIEYNGNKLQLSTCQKYLTIKHFKQRIQLNTFPFTWSGRMWAMEPKAKGRTVIFSDNSCSWDMYQVLGEGVLWSMNGPWSASLHWHLKILEGEKGIQGREKWSGKNRDATEQGAGQGHAAGMTEVWVRKSGLTEGLWEGGRGCRSRASISGALTLNQRMSWGLSLQSPWISRTILQGSPGYYHFTGKETGGGHEKVAVSQTVRGGHRICIQVFLTSALLKQILICCWWGDTKEFWTGEGVNRGTMEQPCESHGWNTSVRERHQSVKADSGDSQHQTKVGGHCFPCSSHKPAHLTLPVSLGGLQEIWYFNKFLLIKFKPKRNLELYGELNEVYMDCFALLHN